MRFSIRPMRWTATGEIPGARREMNPTLLNANLGLHVNWDLRANLRLRCIQGSQADYSINSLPLGSSSLFFNSTLMLTNSFDDRHHS
jgi:hypothetical protein